MANPAGFSNKEASFPLFDWLRFVLASVVVLGHAGFDPGVQTGNFAVCVFLALSGWLIGGILVRSRTSDLPRFYFNRGIRIWIPYLFAVCLLYTIALLKEGVGPRYFQFLFYDLTFTHYWFFPKTPEVIAIAPMQGTGAHFWSISVEEQFYLFAPLAILLVPFGRSIYLWALLFVVALVFDRHYASISIGVLAVVATHRLDSWTPGPMARLGFAAFALAGIGLFQVLPGLYVHLAPFVALAIVLFCLVAGDRRPLGRFLGGVSFPMYLNHWFGLFVGHWIARRLMLPALPKLALEYLAGTLVGVATYLLIDRWVLQRRQAWFTPNRGKALTAVAYGLLIIGVLVHFLWLPPLG